jgi:zinc D-Ala-D-Ala carboxypeptidase
MKLSNNFTLAEMTKSQIATRKGISNDATDEHIENMRLLCVHVLQPVRNKFGSTTISSGYRSEDLNEAIGGSTTSQHSKGEAADFECVEKDNYGLAVWISQILDFDQLILEYLDDDDPHAGWIHCSYVGPWEDGINRKEILKAEKIDGKTVYTKIEL